MVNFNYTQDIVSDDICKWLLSINFPFIKCELDNGSPIYYTLPKDDPNWFKCDAYFKPTYMDVYNWLYVRKQILITCNLYSTSWSVRIEDYGNLIKKLEEIRLNPRSSYKTAKYETKTVKEPKKYGNCWEIGNDCLSPQDCIISAIKYLMQNDLVK